ncbi:Polygalacturonase inhibitor [Rhynchospora pubera]|uniref:Polygalacturonase inhibitor n=1 Tax=Rhynchospora pubera TaxID=906938 RepID=A0AAV8CLF8_9POAL|nr:Polygalacturonase inhibitor [Rhynchospora pubera]
MASTPTLFLYFLLFTTCFTFLFSPATAALCDSDDKRALLAIKKAFNNPYLLASWVPSMGCCDWAGVRCYESTGRVYELYISQDNNLTGTIPSAIASLPYLRYLMFHHLPGITGPIPSAIGKLPQLDQLTISFTSISGPVPSFLASLQSLTQLDLSFNSLSGSIPASLSLIPNLTFIDISRNHLTGQLPPALFQKASQQPAYLRLSHNNLSGEIPTSYSHIDFVQVDLARNKFTGDATLLFGREKPLQKLDLSRNMFQFDLSNVVFPESALYVVDLNHNMIFGSIPQQIKKVDNLQFFNVSYNRLCGPIPTSDRLARFDSYNYLHNKCLCGTPLAPCN